MPLLERKREILAGQAKERQIRKPADSVPENLPEQAKETRDAVAAEMHLLAPGIGFDLLRLAMIETQAPDSNAREKAYRMAYLSWQASLDPRDRALLKEMGLDRPKIESTRASWGTAEVFRDSPSAAGYQDGLAESEFVHPCELIDEPEAGSTDIDESELAKLGAFDPELVANILRICFFPGVGKRGVNFPAAFHRLLALAHCLKVEGVGDKTLDHIATRVGCTRALLSHFAVRIRDHAKLDHRGGKSDEARRRLSTGHLWVPGSRSKHAKRGGIGMKDESQTRTDYVCALS